MMLRRGCPLVVASGFSLDPSWPDRLELWQQENSHFVHRAPTSDELELLTTTEESTESLKLFCLPQHLQDAWWKILDPAGMAAGNLPGFDVFVESISSFLKFKHLALPKQTQAEVLIETLKSDSGEILPMESQNFWGIINLYDQPTSVAYCNLSGSQIQEIMGEKQSNSIAAPEELRSRLLEQQPSYPLVNLRLKPFEGCCFAPSILRFSAPPHNEEELRVVLEISRLPDSA